MTLDGHRGDETRRVRKKREMKRRIYEAAVSRFMEKGYEDTTIEEIAETADVGRATFFNHYPSKAAVLHEIAAEALEYAQETFNREFAAETGTVKDKLKRSLGRFARIVERNPRYYKTVFLDAMQSQAGFVAANRETSDNLIDVLARHLHGAQQRGELDPTLDPGQLAEMLTGIYMYAILNSILNGFPYPLVERIGKAAEIFLEGCRARDG